MSMKSDRLTPHSGKTYRQDPDSIKIVFDAELADLSLGQRVSLFCCMCFSFYDKERSYLYLRENSLESNTSVKCCCGLASSYDHINVNYFDRSPYSEECHPAPFPCCFLFTCEQPKIEIVDNSMLCCFAKVDPCCCGKQVVIMPFENFPIPCCCCKNRVGCCDNCFGCCGQVTGNPKVFSPFQPQPLDAVAFVAAAQTLMTGTVSSHVDNAIMSRT